MWEKAYYFETNHNSRRGCSAAHAELKARGYEPVASFPDKGYVLGAKAGVSHWLVSLFVLTIWPIFQFVGQRMQREVNRIKYNLYQWGFISTHPYFRIMWADFNFHPRQTLAARAQIIANEDPRTLHKFMKGVDPIRMDRIVEGVE
jgi:hypothetical protein